VFNADHSKKNRRGTILLPLKRREREKKTPVNAGVFVDRRGFTAGDARKSDFQTEEEGRGVFRGEREKSSGQKGKGDTLSIRKNRETLPDPEEGTSAT